MSVAEVLFRARHAIASRAGAVGILTARPAPPDLTALGQPFLRTPPSDTNHGAIVAAAEAILEGTWSLFALEPLELGFPPEWNRDPSTGVHTPMTAGDRIDHRDSRLVGDIKYVWELGRHLEVVTLAQAWRVTSSERFASGARALIDSWLHQCPYLRGVHWASSLEVAIRLVNWSAAWQLFGGLAAPLFENEDGIAFRNRWLASIFQHAHYVRTHLSRYSSANNHLFGELTGLFVAGWTWPCWAEMIAWRSEARRGLEHEAQRQLSSDGVNLEQAIHYQNEVMEMMLICLRASEAQGEVFSADFRDRLEKAADFLGSVMDHGGRVPMLGDSDDGIVLRLAQGPDWDPHRSMLASCAVLFDRADFKHKARALDDKTRWLFPEECVRKWNRLDSKPGPPTLAFPHGGYFLLGSNFDTPREVRIVVDAAPLGYLSIAAHGHADALSFTLSVGGNELLVDTGTFAYHTEKPWRDYFRGTLAHNTLRVDGRDQSESGGSFMWLRKARAKALRHEPGSTVQSFVAEHDGYMRLPDPVLHRRELRYDQDRFELVIVDALECRGRHVVEVAWHWSESASVVIEGETISGVHGASRARVRCETPGFAVSLHRGSTEPIVGWVSRRYGRKTPSYTSIWSGEIEGRTEILTRMQIAHEAMTPINGERGCA